MYLADRQTYSTDARLLTERLGLCPLQYTVLQTPLLRHATRWPLLQQTLVENPISKALRKKNTELVRRARTKKKDTKCASPALASLFGYWRQEIRYRRDEMQMRLHRCRWMESRRSIDVRAKASDVSDQVCGSPLARWPILLPRSFLTILQRNCWHRREKTKKKKNPLGTRMSLNRGVMGRKDASATAATSALCQPTLCQSRTTWP